MTRVKDDIVLVKEAFKWALQGLIAKELGGVAVVTRVTPQVLQSCIVSCDAHMSA